MTQSSLVRMVPGLIPLLSLISGCAGSVVPATKPETPTVQVAVPVQRQVTDYADFTARAAAVDSVEVRARVHGYLDSVHFKAGSLVQKGDVLFVIDQRPFVRELNQAKAQLEQTRAEYQRALTLIESAEAAKARADATLANARSRHERDAKLLARGAVTQEEFDDRKSELLQAEANVRHDIAGIASAKAAVVTAKAAEAAAMAAVALAELNLEYTTVSAPISGRISRNLVSTGNLIQAGQSGGGTLLTTIVSVDPMYAYFEVDERTVLRVKQLIREGKANMPDEVEIPVWLGLANEDGYPHQGSIQFVDNQVNPRTGTLRVRGVFSNQDEFLSPGYFARVRVPIGSPHEALLVTERALDTDQGQKIVYVLDEDKKVVVRPVRLGALHDGLREISKGLRPDDRVIVNGLQQVRPGMTAEPQIVSMPGQEGPATPEFSVHKVLRPVVKVARER